MRLRMTFFSHLLCRKTPLLVSPFRVFAGNVGQKIVRRGQRPPAPLALVHLVDVRKKSSEFRQKMQLKILKELEGQTWE